MDSEVVATDKNTVALCSRHHSSESVPGQTNESVATVQNLSSRAGSVDRWNNIVKTI